MIYIYIYICIYDICISYIYMYQRIRRMDKHMFQRGGSTFVGVFIPTKSGWGTVEVGSFSECDAPGSFC